MLGSSRAAAQFAASQEGLSSRSEWFSTANISLALGCLHRADIGNVAGKHTCFLFLQGQSKQTGFSFCVYICLCFGRTTAERVGADSTFRPRGRVDGAPAPHFLSPSFETGTGMYTETHLPYAFWCWRWRQHVPPKHRQHCPYPHGVNTLKLKLRGL
jgi:hypothetical protein